jgi:hypothetical protein
MSIALRNAADSSGNPGQENKLITRDATLPLRPERIRSAFGESARSTDPLTISSEVKTFTAPKSTASSGLRFTAPPTAPHLIRFVSEQRWQGYIKETEELTFCAIIYDMSQHIESNNSDDLEEIEFSKNEVSEIMRTYIKPGAIFFWDIGFQIDPSGQWNRQSIISFPMIPMHTETHYVHALEHAKARFTELGWDKFQK